MNTKLLKAGLVLGLLSVIGPVAIDMYLPALPAIGKALSADAAQVQLSLMSFWIALALCQLVYGPVSDMIGRKPPLYFGIILYIVGSVGCALSRSIEWLVVFRFVQGVGAGAAMSLPRAIVRDNYNGVDAAQLFGLLMLVFCISPTLAPVVGSLVIQLGDWRIIFWLTGAAGVLVLLLAVFALRETRPAEANAESSLGSALKGYCALLRDGRFVGMTLISGAAMSSLLAFAGNSPFVYINHYGLTPMAYSLAFSANAISLAIASLSTGVLVKRFGLYRVLRIAVTGFALAMLAPLAFFSLGIDRIEVLLTLMFVAYGFVGLVFPTTAVLAMAEHGEIAGTASALLGTLQMVASAAVMGLVGLFFNGTALPMVVAFAGCAAVAFILMQFTIRGPESPLAAAAE